MPAITEPTPATDVADAAPTANPLDEPDDEESLVEESLVEEVSIDGMCGVY
jgi:mycofactocin precursor